MNADIKRDMKIAIAALDFEGALRVKKKYEMMHDWKCAKLNEVSGSERGTFGLTPDHIKATPEWKEAFKEERNAFANMREWNMMVARKFKKELRDLYNANRAAKIAFVAS